MRPDSDEPADRDLRAILEMLDPLTRDALRRVLIHDQALPRRDRLGAAALTATDMATTGPTSSTC